MNNVDDLVKQLKNYNFNSKIKINFGVMNNVAVFLPDGTYLVAHIIKFSGEILFEFVIGYIKKFINLLELHHRNLKNFGFFIHSIDLKTGIIRAGTYYQ